MRSRWPSLIVLVALLVCSAPATRGAEDALPPGELFDEFATAYLEAYYGRHPVRATSLGIHDHDRRFPDMSREGIAAAVRELKGWLDRLATIPLRELQGDRALDHVILEHAIRAELLELEEVQGWRRNPLVYNRLFADGIASLVDREFAPLSVRIEDLIFRLGRLQRIVRAGRRNLDEVPRLWAELSLRSNEGTVRFLREDVPAALREQGLAELDSKLQARWDKAHRRGVAQLEQFGRWLEDELLPRANGDFRLGADVFERKLLYEEHFAFTVEELRVLNERAIGEYRVWMEHVAGKIDDEVDVADVVDGITSQYPQPVELIPTARRYVEEGRDFVVENGILTLPTEELPTIRPTPEYARSGFASMSTPGPFETETTQAYYNITNVDPAWPEEQQAQHLTYFNYPGLLGISVHEVMPGHYVQLLFRRQIATDVRKVFMPASLVEGWAHYTEQMMVDEGLGGGVPDVRLGQLRRALQRHARWYAGLAMHAFGETVDEAAQRFQEIAYFAPFPALRETQRGTYNPTYLYYALGRMEILRLREDYRRMVESRGESFSLREFHDRLLRLGLPIPLARRVMLESAGEPATAD